MVTNFFTEHCTQSTDQFISDPLMTATQLESQMIVTQVEAIYKRQQEMCRAFESSRDESVTPQNIVCFYL